MWNFRAKTTTAELICIAAWQDDALRVGYTASFSVLCKREMPDLFEDISGILVILSSTEYDPEFVLFKFVLPCPPAASIMLSAGVVYTADLSCT